MRNSYEGVGYIEWLQARDFVSDDDAALCKGLIFGSGLGAISAVLRSGSMSGSEAYAHAVNAAGADFVRADELAGKTAEWAVVSGWPLRPDWLRAQGLAVFTSA